MKFLNLFALLFGKSTQPTQQVEVVAKAKTRRTFNHSTIVSTKSLISFAVDYSVNYEADRTVGILQAAVSTAIAGSSWLVVTESYDTLHGALEVDMRAIIDRCNREVAHTDANVTEIKILRVRFFDQAILKAIAARQIEESERDREHRECEALRAKLQN